MADEIIRIEWTPDSIRKMENLARLPDEIPQAIRRGMDRGLSFVVGRIQQLRLSGQGPYSPSENRLGVVTGNLQRSVVAQPSVVQGATIIGQISAGKFASVHEYGKTIRATNAPFLVFRIAGKVIRTKQVIIPERAPFRTEAKTPQTAKVISDEINSEIEKAWAKL